MTRARTRIVVAMSGGVDSSLAAALLLERGFDVIGATLLLRPCDDDLEATWCCGTGANDSARGVCGQLGIEHRAVECSSQFEERILRPSWEDYASGRTPNPCIPCNERIKFAVLEDLCEELGAERIATGHYARVDGGGVLRRGVDPGKDQSYFLFSLTEKQRKMALFPLGEMSKPEVRRAAIDRNLASARRPDSQDACFTVEEGGFSEALRMKFGAAASPGPVVDRDGRRLGDHCGVHLYTVGQRKGLGIATGSRAYVSRIDPDTSTVVLTGDMRDLESTGLVATGLRWHGEQPVAPFECLAQIRYRSAPAKVRVLPQGKDVEVIFGSRQRAVAPGQAVVFYDGETVLGGGWIRSPIS